MNEFPASTPDLRPAAPPPGPIALRLPSTQPRVAYTLLGLTVFVYLIQWLTPNYYQNNFITLDLPTFFLAKVNSLIRLGELWRLITPILVHDHSSPLHIGFNMYALFSLGPSLERRFGHGRFLLLYLLAGFSGNALSFLFSDGISVGASTAIFGLIGAEGIFLYQNRKLFGEEAKQAIGNVITIVVINMAIGFSSGGYIDNWGHIGGLLGGLIFAWFGGPLWVVEGVYPLLRLVDKRIQRDVVLGAGLVLLVFGAISIVGIVWPLVP